MLRSPVREKLELLAKFATFTVIVLYVLGLTITNIALAELGVTDYSAIQARFVFVGLCFACFVVLPALPAAAAVAVWTYMRRVVQSGIGMTTVYAGAALFAAIFLPPVALGYFIVFLVDPTSPGGLHMAFWRTLYGHELISGPIAFLALVPAVLLIPPGLPLQRFVRHAALLSAALSIIGLLMPYVQDVYANIRTGVGGGQPEVVYVIATSDFEAALARSNSESIPLLLKRPLLLWDETAERIIVTPLNRIPVTGASVEIRMNAVVALLRTG